MDQISTVEYGSSAYKAAFSYHCLDRFKKMNIPTTVIATKAGLYEESLLTAKTIKGARLIKATDISVSVLEQTAPKLAAIILTDIMLNDT